MVTLLRREIGTGLKKEKQKASSNHKFLLRQTDSCQVSSCFRQEGTMEVTTKRLVKTQTLRVCFLYPDLSLPE